MIRKITLLLMCVTVTWNSQAQENNDAETWYQQSLELFEKKENSQGLELLTRAAENGNPKAQYDLGGLYQTGRRGVKSNVKKAIQWYKKASDQGYDNATYDLATIYFWGRGVAQDSKKAINLYTKVGEHGDTQALLMAGIIYHTGDGLMGHNFKKALDYYIKAAKMGDDRGECMYGLMQYRGHGMKANPTEGLSRINNVANKGCGCAQLLLSSIDKERAEFWKQQYEANPEKDEFSGIMATLIFYLIR